MSSKSSKDKNKEGGPSWLPIAGLATTGVAVTGAAAAIAMRKNGGGRSATAEKELAIHLSDMLTLDAFVVGELDSHLEDDKLRVARNERALEEDARRMLMMQSERLQRELEAMNERVSSKTKPTAAAMVGVAASLGERVMYKGMQGYPVSRMTRDTYTMLSAIAVSLTMLHASARALHADSLAEATSKQLAEVGAMVVKFSEQIPRTVIREFGEGFSEVDVSVADSTVSATKGAWAEAAR